MRLILLAFIICFTSYGFTQSSFSDSKLKKTSNKFLNNEFGSRFVKRNFNFLFIKNHGLDVAVYELKRKNHKDEQSTLLIFFKYLKNEIDTSRFAYTKQDIIDCIAGDSCKLLISINKAKQIAINAGLRKGDRPWKINVMYLGKTQTPAWAIVSTDYDFVDGHGAGQSIEINMQDGSCKERMWQAKP